MAKLTRPGLTASQQADLWRRWRSGHSLKDICHAMGRTVGTVHQFIRLRGGFSPPPRRRSARVLSMWEREEVSRGIATSVSLRQIAAKLGRSASTVSREIARHGGPDHYRASDADLQAWDSALRPKACRLASNPRLRRIVAQKLQLDWSPQQIAGWLALRYADEDSMRVSHETIYRSLFVQTRGVLKKELLKHLRGKHLMRHGRTATSHREWHGQIVDAVPISERPAEADDRAVPGHWEGDLIAGSGNTHIATLVERHSRFTMLVKLPSREAINVANALSKQVRKLPTALRRSLTWDRGMELAFHKRFSVATDVKVYFCDPYSPWQRGTNENTNRLLRQYFPKGTDLSAHSQTELDKIALRLNQRPRKTLGYLTPADKLRSSVALTS